MKLVIGLGNPGKKYEKTRHNVGFMAIDLFLKKHNISGEKDKFLSKVLEVTMQGEKIYFLKPQTYMNLSGNAVHEIVQFYKINPISDMLVVYDDKDLPLGKLRYKIKGSSGGHNGIKSIISHVGQEFCRIKCGIGNTDGNVIDFVIGDFQKSEEEDLQSMLEVVVEGIEDWIQNKNSDRMMQKYNKK